ncbi:hypothetical protein [Streptomyces sp. NPDC049585]|uniref:hypothetical protein n=1 Tax=Streptomyces sp. NPDC049585 TaxID=3155154 RepID=UPI00341CF004
MSRPSYRYWCELHGLARDGSRLLALAGEPTKTPRLAVRWLRWHALYAANRLDPAPEDPHHLGLLRAGYPASRPDPTQILRAWEGDIQAHEQAMAELRNGESFALVVAPFAFLTAAPLYPRAAELHPRPRAVAAL